MEDNSNINFTCSIQESINVKSVECFSASAIQVVASELQTFKHLAMKI
jgi:hypothetical protein